jgi:hypothetical protein
MSYCRWSSNDSLCDVYVYADVSGGWTTHVAGNRLVYKGELPPPFDWDNEENVGERFIERERIVRKLRKEAERVNIGLPHDGATFNDPTPGECADRLESLRSMGYVVPQYAIDALREEQAEMHTPPQEGE